MFLAFCALHLLGHRNKEMKDWTVKGALAIRGQDPYEHLVDQALIEIIQSDTHDDATRIFFLKGLLARKGIVWEKYNGEVIADNSEDSGETIQQKPDEADRH